MKIFKIFITTILLFSIAAAFAQEKQTYKIIVNGSNEVTSLTKNEAAKLFLKKTTRWQDGKKVLPVDLIDLSKVRQNFSSMILNKKVSAVKAYWQKQIFSGRNVPPVEKKTDKEVLQYVQDTMGAIGYVAVSTKTDNYKVNVVNIK